MVASFWGSLGFSLAAITAAFVASSSHAQTVSDGDTLKFNGKTYRLWGIDAPETKQWCEDYPAGVIATGALEKLIKTSSALTCEPRTTDRYGRTIAVCKVDGRDLGETMVELGMAWAFTRYSADYVAAEQRARSQELGIHSHNCIPAWEWRAANKNH